MAAPVQVKLIFDLAPSPAPTDEVYASSRLKRPNGASAARTWRTLSLQSAMRATDCHIRTTQPGATPGSLCTRRLAARGG
jgi:hypothetical protein